MAFRRILLLAVGVALVAGVLVPLACNPTVDEELGNVGQRCFANMPFCDPGLTCVLLPLDGGGYDGGECFPLSDEDGGDATEGETEEPEGDEGDASLDAGASDAEIDDAPVDAPHESAATDGGSDAASE